MWVHHLAADRPELLLLQDSILGRREHGHHQLPLLVLVAIGFDHPRDRVVGDGPAELEGGGIRLDVGRAHAAALVGVERDIED
jgi:hypothetical protein